MSRRRALLMSGRKRYHKYLIGYYPFDNDFKDRKSPYSDLVESVTGNISFVAGRVDNSAYCPPSINTAIRDVFNSTNKKYIFDDGVGTVPYTISMHVKIISAGSMGGTIVGLTAENSSQASTNSVWKVGASSTGVIYFRKYSLGALTDYTDYRVEDPLINEWFQLTISDDAQGNVKIWFENTLQTATVTNAGTGFVRFGSNNNQYFGLFNALGVPSANRFFEGYVDDLALFKGYAFTQEDVDYVNNNGNPRRIY